MIATGMDYRDTEVVEIAAAASDLFLFIGVADDRQGNAARTHPDASLVRDHGEVSGRRKVTLPLLDLHPVAFRLILIGGGQDDVILHGESLR